MVVPHPHWPLFDLVIHSPRLEIRLAREHEFVELTEVIDAGIHDPATMPFSNPFTDEPLPERHRNSYQWWWRQRADWSPDAWAYDGVVFHEGCIIGVQSLMAKQF